MAVPGRQAPTKKCPAATPRAEVEFRILLAEARRVEDRAIFQARREAIEVKREETAFELDQVELGRRRVAIHRDGLGLARDVALTAVCLVAAGIILGSMLTYPEPRLALAALGVVVGGGLGIKLWRRTIRP